MGKSINYMQRGIFIMKMISKILLLSFLVVGGVTKPIFTSQETPLFKIFAAVMSMNPKKVLALQKELAKMNKIMNNIGNKN